MLSWRRNAILPGVIALCLAMLAPLSHAAPIQQVSISKPKHPNQRPNIVLIVSDDQTNWEMQWMPKTRRLLGDHGTTFTNAINPHPLCCPARAEILSGEFAQNNGVRHNKGPYGGYPRFASYRHGRNLHDNLASWLQSSGYRTAFVGKMLNGYSESQPQMDGWTYWSPLIAGTYDYYNFTLANNGRPQHFDRQYVTDVLKNKARKVIQNWSGQKQPFFLWVSNVAPHHAGGPYEQSYYHNKDWNPPIPAPKDRHLFSKTALPTKQDPSFNEADMSDKPRAIRNKPKVDPREETFLFRQRIRALQSVDRANAAIVHTLQKQGVLQNTVVIYITDNGYMLGEHRISSKNYPYDADLRIPMLWRGPGIPSGVTNDQTATTVDIAPTILSFARILQQVRNGQRTDGEGLKGVFDGTTTLNSTSLIQGGTAYPDALKAFGWSWRGVRTARYTYVYWWTGEEELYDREVDPSELNNLYDNTAGQVRDPAYSGVLDEMRRRYDLLKGCAGVQSCERQDFGADPEPSTP